MTELMERKRRVVNNKAVGELMAVLKERLTETNLNLRAKVLVCINRVVHAIGGAAVEYASVLLPSMLRLCGEAKQNVVDALFAALTTWVEADEMQRELLFNAIGSYLSVGLKIPKGRLALLTWMNKFTALMNAKTVAAIASDLLDCLTDKVAAVRMQAQLVLETAAKLVPRSTLGGLKGFCGARTADGGGEARTGAGEPLSRARAAEAQVGRGLQGALQQREEQHPEADTAQRARVAHQRRLLACQRAVYGLSRQ